MKPDYDTTLNNYTSTGVKFWQHEQAMQSYRDGTGHTVVSTHISPESICNLRCSYCSVDNRDTSKHINMDVVRDYVIKLQSRGLKAVILTGGGEPTLYKKFNELVQWLKFERDLDVGLITNGTMFRLIEPKTFSAFSWIRMSLNIFDDWEAKTGVDFQSNLLDSGCIMGCSMVVETKDTLTDQEVLDGADLLGRIAKVADKIGAEYIRLLPNCRLKYDQLNIKHNTLDTVIEKTNDTRFFHQYKNHRKPSDKVCHQSYFRPYLSEVPYQGSSEPGSVYPCDSVVLNRTYQEFADEYQICRPENILDFMDSKGSFNYVDPTSQCAGCVFTDNVEMLGKWKRGEIDLIDQHKGAEVVHKNFI
jgi:organic radical activating enzyme